MNEPKDDTASAGEEPVKLLVHRCKFVDYTHPAITLLSLDPYSKGRQIACVRKSGDIELWGRWRSQWYCEKIIYGTPTLVPSAIVWIKRDYEGSEKKDKNTFHIDEWSRIFACYLNGEIVEWDVNTLTPLSRTEIGGGGINSAKVSPIEPYKFAISSEDTKVRVVKVDGDSIELVTLSESSRSKILTLDWNHDGKSIVCGGNDGKIVIFNTNDGRIIDVVKLPNPSDKIVWSVICLSQSFFVTGDSSGEVNFWDSRMCLPTCSFQSHDADVLTLEQNADGTVIWSSGVDQKIVSYVLHNKDNSRPTWLQTGFKKYHTHDVYSLLYINGNPDLLVSAGMDSNLVYISPTSSFPNCKPIRMPCYPSKPIIQINRENRLLLVKYPDSIKVTKLACTPSYIGTPAAPREGTEKLLLHFKPSLASNIISACISRTADWIAISDIDQTRVYKFKLNKALQAECDKCIIRYKLPQNIKLLPAGYLLEFCDRSKLVIASLSGKLCLYNIGRENDIQTFEPVLECKKSTIVSLAVSNRGPWIGCGFSNNRIIVYNVESMQIYMSLNYSSNPLHTSLSFSPSCDELVVTLISNEFFIYDVSNKKLTKWSSENSTSLPKYLINMADYIMGSSSPPNNKKMLALYGPTFSCFVNMHRNISDEVHNALPQKKFRESRDKFPNVKNSHPLTDFNKQQQKSCLKLERRYAPLMMLDFLSDNELVVFEHPVLKFLDKLPPSFTKRAFGA